MALLGGAEKKRQGGDLLMVQKSGDSPVDMVNTPTGLQGFIHVRWLFGISEPSTVWQSLSHKENDSLRMNGW